MAADDLEGGGQGWRVDLSGFGGGGGGLQGSLFQLNFLSWGSILGQISVAKGLNLAEASLTRLYFQQNLVILTYFSHELYTNYINFDAVAMANGTKN